MRHIQMFEAFGVQSHLSSDNVASVYHVSISEIKELTSDPMWFALEKSHSDEGWFLNALENDGEAYQYSGRFVGKVGFLYDPEVKAVFDAIDEDPDDYSTELVSNPTAEEVMNLKATKALIDAGYDGLIYYDYDPRDFQNDLEALIVYNPLKSIRDWRLVKKASS